MSIALGAGGTDTFMFDAAGNQTQIASPTSTLDSSFDDASRQTAVGDTIFLVEHRYDGRGFLERSERTYPGALFVDGFESGDFACWSDVDGGPVGGTCPVDPPFVAPTYSSDGLLHHLLRGFGNDQRWVIYHAGRPVAMVKEVGGGAAEVMFLTTDHLGTPVLAMDAVGGEVWEGGFEPFGADFSGAGGSDVFLRFPGQWDDGLMAEGGAYNVNRWYRAGLGRYNRKDPFGDVEERRELPWYPRVGLERFSLYSYVDANPIAFVDPLGLLKFKGCSPADETQITAAFEQTCAKIKDPSFATCLCNSPRITEGLPKKCDDDNRIVRCTDKSSGRCSGRCAWSIPFGRTIRLCKSAFASICGPLGCTLFHEITHQLGFPGEAKPNAVEECLGC